MLKWSPTQIFDLMGHPTGEKLKDEETDKVIANRADLTFQVDIFYLIRKIRILKHGLF